MTIRAYQKGDHLAIAAIFSRAVHEIACEHYTEAQCLAWSDREPNGGHWEKRCEMKQPFVAIVNSQIAGFLELDPDGHIDCAYVNPDFKRRGVMTGLVKHAVSVAFEQQQPRVWVDASLCIKPLFDQLGFSTLEERLVSIKDQTLVNYRMELQNTEKESSVIDDV